MTATHTNQANNNKEDLSAYFASLMTPVLVNPGNSTRASGSAYSYQIQSLATSDYLVTSTTYGATATGITFNVSATGLVTATLPTVSTPTNYTVTLSARNAAAAPTTGSVSFTLTVNPPIPVINSGLTGSGTVGVNGTQYTISAINGPTSYARASGTLPPGTSLSGAVVSGTPTTAGTYTATFTASNVTGTSAASGTVTFTIGKGNQTSSFSSAAPAGLLFGGTATVTASATSGLAVSYTASGGGCSVVAGTGVVTGTVAGTNNCTISATQGGNANYNAVAVPATQTFSIGKANQTSSFSSAVPTGMIVGGTATVTASATSGLAVSYTASGGGCAVNASTGLVTGTVAGTCTISATQAGNANYAAVAAPATQTFSISKANQTSSFSSAVPTGMVVGGTATVTAAATSGLAVSYTASGGGCSVNASSGLVTGTAAGTNNCTISATQAGNADYNAVAAPATQTFSIGKANQTSSFSSALPTLAVGGTTTVTAAATSGLAVSYTASGGGCSVVAGTGVVTGTAAGTSNCTISATQAGNANYNAVAAPATQTFSIGKGTQTITGFSAPATLTVSGTATLSATAGASTSALVFGVTAGSAGVCHVTGSTVTADAVGTCTVTADQAADANYNAATQVTQSIAVGLASQSVSFGAAPVITYVASPSATGTVSATATSGLAVTFSSATTSVCTISGTTVTALAAGSCTINVNQAGNGAFAAASQVQQTFTISKANQTVSFGTAPTIVVNGTGTVSATATSNLSITSYSSTTPAVCSISGTTVTGVTAGTCTITATQNGDGNYNSATGSQNITIGAASQIITFGTAPTLALGGTGAVSATAGSGLTVTFSSLTPSVCSISGTTVTDITAGTCTIAANQGGNANYNAAPQATQSITIGQVSQTISFGAAPSLIVEGTATVSATASSGLTVTFSSLTPLVCSIAGTTVTDITVGTCTIAANQGGNTNYSAAPQATQSLNIAQGSQTISFGAAPASLIAGGSATVSATATSGLAVTFSSSTPLVCTLSGSTVTGVSGGTCTILANQPGNLNYSSAAQVAQSFSVGTAGQTISFGTAPSLAVGGTATVSATSTSGLAVVLTSTTTGVCTIAGNTVTGVTPGTCTITANQAGNGFYSSAAQVTQNITVGIGSQTITFGAAPTLVVGGTATVSAVSSVGLAVTFTSTTTGICTVSGATVSGLVAGTCTIAANQAGNSNYAAAAQVTQSFAVSNLPAVPAAAAMSTPLNTAGTLDLASSITGAGVTGVSIASQPAHGKAVAVGTKVTYTPVTDYFGTDTFTYRAHNAAGASVDAATVTVTITGRPDPLKDARVTGLAKIEAAVTKRFGKAQAFNFQQRLESRHHASSRSDSTAVALNDAGKIASPVAVGGAQIGPGNYFNSWQPTTVLSYSNDPNTLLHATALGRDGKPVAADPLALLVASVMRDALTSSSFNLANVSNAVASANQDDAFSRVEVWAAGNVRFGSSVQSGVESKFSTDGVSIGADKRIDRKLTLGMGIGYASDKSVIGTDGTNSSSIGNSVATYANYQMDEGTFIDALLGYGKVNFNTNRYVSSVNDYARASRQGDQIFGSVSYGYDYRNDGLLWSSYGRLDYSFDRLAEGTESGAGANALSYAGQISRNSQLALGMRAQSVHEAAFGVVQPHVRLEYQRGIETSDDTSIAYADLLGTQYSIAGTTQNTHSMVLGLGSDFFLSKTARFSLNYQRLTSAERDNYQSFSFRFTKDIEGKNDMDDLLAAINASSAERPSGWIVAASLSSDDNIGRASEMKDKLYDSIFNLTVGKSKSIRVSPHTRLALNGFMDVDSYRSYTGLGRISVGGQAEFKYRVSGEFSSPTFGVFGRYSADKYQSALRDGSRRSAGVTLRQPVTDRINLFAAAADNTRAGQSDVFNTHDVSARLNLDYALASNQMLYLTGEQRRGDMVSSGTPSLPVLDVATVFVRDDVFASPALFAYRMEGHTALLTLGYNWSFGTKDSIDISARRVESNGDKIPPTTGAPLRYIVNQYAISYLMAF